MSQERSYTIEEVAQLLKISKLTTYDLVKKGEIPVFRVGRQMRIDALDLETYIEKQKISNKDATTKPMTRDNQTIVISGQDLVLDLLGKYITKNSLFKTLRSHEGSLNGLIALYQEETDIASLHMYDGDTGEYNTPYVKKLFVSQPYIIVNVVSRKAGFYVQKGNPLHIHSFKDLAKSNVLMMNREKGSGARTLLDEQLRIHQIVPSTIKGYDQEETNHLGVATAVATGEANVGIGIEKTAILVDVDFVPFIDERYDLVLLKTEKNHLLIEEVQKIVTSEAFHAELRSIGGYDLSKTGTIIHETF
ncbi:substrate-binding domain-containing protein [Rummeliibacillus sp. NPDC094406]|uniref:substrate-binding domain-containing protein n=1 Tax=Rummeliibacillus sp. NPDC094406 TaxID=3364511 RepID=UPI003826F38E